MPVLDESLKESFVAIDFLEINDFQIYAETTKFKEGDGIILIYFWKTLVIVTLKQ